MNPSVFIAFGKPSSGWLPVDLSYGDFHISFDASNVLNNPVAELRNVTENLQVGDCRKIEWWLEPAVYVFDFVKEGERVTFSIFEQDDLHDENAEQRLLLSIAGDSKEILLPFTEALNAFYAKQYDERDWAA
ncbi:MAG TPA: hypothetical protein VGD89_13925 [Flavipsychrobacter sp.]